MCSFNRWNTEMTNFENYVCVCFVLCLCRDWFCGLTWQKLYIWEVLKCTFAYDMVWLSLGDPLWLTWCWNPITNFCAVVSVNVGPWSAQWSVLLSGPGLCSGHCCCQALICAVVSVAVRTWSVQWSVLLLGLLVAMSWNLGKSRNAWNRIHVRTGPVVQLKLDPVLQL